MGTTDDIIKKIMADPKLSGSKSFENKVYTDQPILRKASQMSAYLPEKYKEMRAIASSPVYIGRSEAWIFVKQANFMSNFEDDFDYNEEYVQYFPTYQRMSDKQLRGYFSWRTKVKKGEISNTSLSFVYLYIYELLNCVGYNKPVDSFIALKSFWKKYRKIDNRIDRFSVLWMCDFVVFHDLPKDLLDDVYDFDYEEAIEKVSQPEMNDIEVFDAISVLSSYNIKTSKGYRSRPDAYSFIVSKAFYLFSDYYRSHRKNTLSDKLFGSVIESTYNMFMSAVFCGRNNHINCHYSFNSIHSYTCKDGVWTRRKCFGSKMKSSELGVFVKACDRVIRERLCIDPPLVQGKETKLMLSFINKAFDMWQEAEKQKELRKIEIDTTKLSGIRNSADIIRDKLIVDEEGSDELCDVICEVVPEERTEAEKTDDNSILDFDERMLISLLLDDGDYNSYIKEKGLMLSIVVDSINEKLFDDFSDTVIDFDMNRPYIIEDYIDDIKKYR